MSEAWRYFIGGAICGGLVVHLFWYIAMLINVGRRR